MKRDDIINLMQQACDPDKKPAWHNGFWTITQLELDLFVDLVLKAERQACAEALREALDQTNPPQRKPLTEEQIKPIFDQWKILYGGYTIDFIRAIERAHGIGSEE